MEQQLTKIENQLSQRKHTKRKIILAIILIIVLLIFSLIVLGVISYSLFESGDSSTTTIIHEKEIP
ncbi:hypothetical protein [Bacillus sp. 123MFChir2]|uniref:hypothetical protein n=1 Tax=Bacillus sp. 123MFChir2 TaxID=1169144 RepID=UPI00038253C1|nr:hypothetical protein [Bacillus sp. 123MFChir2]